MKMEDIRLLFDYSYAATGRVLDAAGQLSEEEFVTPPPPRGASNVRDVLVHTLDAELGWRIALQSRGEESAPELHPAAFPNVTTLADAWRVDEARMRAWLDTLDDETLNAPVFEGGSVPMWVYLAHVVNHGTQHRSEAAMILTQRGQSPGDLDLTFYLKGWSDD